MNKCRKSIQSIFHSYWNLPYEIIGWRNILTHFVKPTKPTLPNNFGSRNLVSSGTSYLPLVYIIKVHDLRPAVARETTQSLFQSKPESKPNILESRIALSYTRLPHILQTSSWWRHQMETFSALLALCAGNSPVPVISPHKGQWRGVLMFSLICPNKRLSKQPWGWWFETPSWSLWRQCNDSRYERNGSLR